MITEYLQNKKIVVLSPHLDDALLSAGMLLYSLKDKADVTVVNIFTKAHSGPYTFSAKKFIKDSGYTEAVSLFNQRKIEDSNAVKLVNAKQINLDLEDALFRKRNTQSLLGKIIPEVDHIYPTYRWHIIKSVAASDSVVEKIQAQLKKIVTEDTVVLAPYGIGGHADHLVTRKAAEIFTNVVYYVDFPYDVRMNEFGKAPLNYRSVNSKVDLKIKDRFISLYKSQVNSLFPNGVMPQHEEQFFIKNNT